jgi:catechol 2,3-dioxygenase-like lactoylglutathione lyase family enzyme
MTVVGLHHVQLAMPKGGEAKAISFYEGLLGLPQVEKPSHLEVRGGCWFEVGTVRIHLGVEDDFRPARKAHPALLISGLARMKEHLVSAGVEVVDDVPLPGFERFYTYDPFGNRLELREPLF